MPDPLPVLPVQTTPEAMVVWSVDDDADDQLLIRLAFTSLRPAATVSALDSGTALIDQIRQANPLPSVLLLDLNMPLMSGFELLTWLRSRADYDALPIVVLSTSSLPEDRERALALGANQFVTKPSSLSDLIRLAKTITTQWVVG